MRFKSEAVLCVSGGQCLPVIAYDSLGEYYLRSVLRIYLGETEAIAAASTWRGDRIIVAMNQKKTEGNLR